MIRNVLRLQDWTILKALLGRDTVLNPATRVTLRKTPFLIAGAHSPKLTLSLPQLRETKKEATQSASQSLTIETNRLDTQGLSPTTKSWKRQFKIRLSASTLPLKFLAPSISRTDQTCLSARGSLFQSDTLFSQSRIPSLQSTYKTLTHRPGILLVAIKTARKC